jgi:hypothetical protein
MPKDLPLKSRLLMSFEGNDMWDYEAIEPILKEDGKADSEYWRLTARFWLAELSINGLLETVEEDVDDGTHFGPNKMIAKYHLTEYGLQAIDSMLR